MPNITRFSKYRPHPWHGLEPGENAPEQVTAYIEITPFDLVKYEIDKESGYLKLDRPQLTSSLPPALYGFIPQTYCGSRVAALAQDSAEGDGDPLDICVITSRSVGRSEMIVTARVIGVLRTTDTGLADDKIIGIIDSDPIYGEANDLSDLPDGAIEPLRHYFSTYKLRAPDPNPMILHGEEGRESAHDLVGAAMADYQDLLNTDESK